MTMRRDPEEVVRKIKRKTNRKFSAEDLMRIVLNGLSALWTHQGQTLIDTGRQ